MITTLEGMILQCGEDSRLWFPKVYAFSEMETLIYHILSLGGEAGELQNKAKKIWRDQGRIDLKDIAPSKLDALADEAIDVQIYLANVFALLKVDPFVEYDRKREFNVGRFARAANV